MIPARSLTAPASPPPRIPDLRRWEADLGTYTLRAGDVRARIVIPGPAKLTLISEAANATDNRVTRGGIVILARRVISLRAQLPESSAPAFPPPPTVEGRMKNVRISALAWRALDRSRTADPAARDAADLQLEILRADIDSLLELTEGRR